ALSGMDLAFAKAEFARQYRACIPQFSASRELALREARHPLLESALRTAGREPVPLTIELRPPQTLVIISGPNTGGKTVALKTIGIAALMAQAGLPVSALEARLPLFSRILADIGDQQSIEQNLSTFSAHIRNIQAMAETADGNDLVLLDEIGSSTDPQEGAALAIAILEHFRGRGAITIASTHHSRLKAYAAETPGVMNAAMDFDEATLAPTYQFLMGLPGKSSGLEIAQRIGLDPEIVNSARALIDPSQTEASALVAWLHAQREEQEREWVRLRQQSREMEARESQMKERWMAERQAKLRELDRRLEETLRDYDKRWKTAIEQIRRQAQQAETAPSKAPGRAGRKGEALGREAREEWNAQVLEAIGTPAAASEVMSVPAVLGDQVRLRSLSTPGVVTAVLDKNELEVEVGRVRMRVPQSEVLVLARQHAEGASAAAPVAVAVVLPENDETAPATEINVIGNTAAEAKARVDEYLDRAFLRGRFTVRIVHGYGKGVLRKELHEMFASHPHVERYYPAPQQEGGAGATIVELKR
ncbi:MAG TPA: Smr/MutS family protein, partial [Terriglobia bacterium]|nr:Smr/MutS family protein [Terriglobia bacterium]